MDRPPKKGIKGVPPRATRARTARNEWLLREVRSRMTKRQELLSPHLRRLERMERAARIWVNGREVGEGPSRNGYPNDVND
jgi:hypothetical protein